MAVVTAKGSRIITGLTGAVPALADPGEGGGIVRYWCETVEVGSSDSATSTYHLARIPSNARILGLSKLHFDDLASTGSPTLDIGVFGVRSTQITDDADALNDGIDCASAAGSASVVKDVANYGKRLWEYVNGQTTDPGGDLDIKVTLADAAVNAGGTITLELLFAID